MQFIKYVRFIKINTFPLPIACIESYQSTPRILFYNLEFLNVFFLQNIRFLEVFLWSAEFYHCILCLVFKRIHHTKGGHNKRTESQNSIELTKYFVQIISSGPFMFNKCFVYRKNYISPKIRWYYYTIKEIFAYTWTDYFFLF